MTRTVFLCLAVFACVASGRAVAQDADAAYRSAVQEARTGRTAQALEALRPLVASQPARQDLLGDYAVVLGWDGQHAAAIDLLAKIDRAAARPYVLEGLGSSARRLKRLELAESLYRQAIARAAERVEPQIGLALTLADAGRLGEAAAMVEALRLKYPNRADVLEAHAEVDTARRQYFHALADYQAILAAEPAHRGALRGKIFTLERLGAPALAAELADRTPGLVDERERAALAAGSTASKIRWGAIAADTGRGTERFATLDRALAESDAAGTRALEPAAELSPVERQLALDRVAALSARFRMQEALALYQALAARKDQVPPYVKASAAAAYLYLEQPERARDLYREVLAVQPDSLESRLGLFYALAESEDHRAALAEIERLVADTPSRIDAWSPATIRENPAYARVLGARALAPLYANRV
ncbi:MAG TPA: tetratricopeptide repeat protein, partial [Polyangiales bacterium]|nr:tetratricopeptide repeat protein [Polyangiales bacterium]